MMMTYYILFFGTGTFILCNLKHKTITKIFASQSQFSLLCHIFKTVWVPFKILLKQYLPFYGDAIFRCILCIGILINYNSLDQLK